MNIVFDAGLQLGEEYRKALEPILTKGQQPLKLNSLTGKVDGTPNVNEGFVFVTKLSNGAIMNYHAAFFTSCNKAPQWFLVLVNESDQSIYDLKNAEKRFDLKNCIVYHADSVDAFAEKIKAISETKKIIKKTLLFSKHKYDWIADLAGLLFDDEIKYEIKTINPMSPEKIETNAHLLLLCGEEVVELKVRHLPNNMEPYFIFAFKNDPQSYINDNKLLDELALYYDMTTERVKSRLFFIDVEGEKWLSEPGKTTQTEAVKAGILVYDAFGLPVSRVEYTENKISDSLDERHRIFEVIKEYCNS